MACTGTTSHLSSVEFSPSWEADSRSVTRDIHRLLGNVKVHFCFHTSMLLASVLNQINQVHTLISLKSVLVLFFHLWLGFKLFLSGFLTWILPFFISARHATCFSNLMFFDFILLIINMTQSTNYGAPHYVILSVSFYFLLRSKYSSQVPLLRHLRLCSPLNLRDKVSYPHLFNLWIFLDRWDEQGFWTEWWQTFS